MSNYRKRNKVGDIHTTRLADGSLIVMPAQMQASWVHRIKQQTAASGPRINLTFRMMPESASATVPTPEPPVSTPEPETPSPAPSPKRAKKNNAMDRKFKSKKGGMPA
jgi:hypothetical protein